MPVKYYKKKTNEILKSVKKSRNRKKKIKTNKRKLQRLLINKGLI